jgi:hypothetical protein
MTLRPFSSACLVLDIISESFSLKIVLLYEWPRITHSRPISLKCFELTSPVYAPNP